MHEITKTDKGYDIYLTRGDSLILGLTLTLKNGDPYVPQVGDKFRFAMKRKYSDPDAMAKIIKNISPDSPVLEIEPEDTKRLPMNRGYVYDIQYTDAFGRVDTFIEGAFFVGNEVL